LRTKACVPLHFVRAADCRARGQAVADEVQVNLLAVELLYLAFAVSLLRYPALLSSVSEPPATDVHVPLPLSTPGALPFATAPSAAVPLAPLPRAPPAGSKRKEPPLSPPLAVASPDPPVQVALRLPPLLPALDAAQMHAKASASSRSSRLADPVFLYLLQTVRAPAPVCAQERNN
jgi:hypothetical protein